ncbi:MAG: hypothetical protein JW750_09525, partial [Anaerolineaceae bacterium]|nr:hypothetical protein [Anaerolineaceae bacterium]
PIPSSVDGRSMLSLTDGQTVSNWTDYLHGEHIVRDQTLMYITNGHEKYVWFSGDGTEQFFDLDADPQECVDQVENPFYQDRVAFLRQWLIEELDGREEGFTDGARLIAGRRVRTVLKHLRDEVCMA